MATGMHYLIGTKSIMIGLLHSVPASPLQSQGEPDTGSDDQTELSRYKRLYTRAREDLEKLNGQAKRR